MRNLLLVVGLAGGALMACSSAPQGYGSPGGPGMGGTGSGSSSGGGATTGDDAGDPGEGSAPASPDAGGGVAPDAGGGVAPDAGGGPSPDSGAPVPLPDAGVTPSVCSSGTFYHSGGGDGNQVMAPGEACVSCHNKSNEAQHFTIGGTVYKTLNEPVDCNGVSQTGVTVIITDANGKTLTLPVNNVGNFMSTTSIALPYKAAVSYNGNTLSMLTAQTSGDCNSCHTPTGTNFAPGRIMLP